MEITLDKLIESLINKPVTERELGYNDAIIELLKFNHLPKGGDKFKESFIGNNIVYFRMLNDDVINDIKSHLVNGELLMAIKRLKDVTGMGLKEAKDVIDRYRGNDRYI